MKTGAWWLTGSIGYLSDALESVVNLAGAGFALWMVSSPSAPPTRITSTAMARPNTSPAAFEGGLILVAALIILLTATTCSIRSRSARWGSAPCCRSARA